MQPAPVVHEVRSCGEMSTLYAPLLVAHSRIDIASAAANAQQLHKHGAGHSVVQQHAH